MNRINEHASGDWIIAQEAYMTPMQFERILRKHDLISDGNVWAASVKLGVTERSIRRYLRGDRKIPRPISRLLEQLER